MEIGFTYWINVISIINLAYLFQLTHYFIFSYQTYNSMMQLFILSYLYFLLQLLTPKAIVFNNKSMGSCACFYGQKLQKYKDLYPVSNKLTSEDPRLQNPQFLKEQIKKLDYIIKHQNLDLARLQHQNDKLRVHPRNQKKVLNNSKKLFLMTRNGLLCRPCLQQNDTNKIPVDELVNMEGLCGKCKGQGLLRENLRVKDKQCGKCNRFYEYLWKVEICTVCNGVGVLYVHGKNPYSNQVNQVDQYGATTNQQLAKKY